MMVLSVCCRNDCRDGLLVQACWAIQEDVESLQSSATRGQYTMIGIVEDLKNVRGLEMESKAFARSDAA